MTHYQPTHNISGQTRRSAVELCPASCPGLAGNSFAGSLMKSVDALNWRNAAGIQRSGLELRHESQELPSGRSNLGPPW